MSVKILVVDDDSVFVHMHRVMVKRSGCTQEPVCFEDGKPAFDYLQDQPASGEKYLVLLDINMPKMDGWQFLDAVQNLPVANAISVVMATSSTDAVDKEKAFQYPQVIDYLEKPLNTADFKKLMEMPPFQS